MEGGVEFRLDSSYNSLAPISERTLILSRTCDRSAIQRGYLPAADRLARVREVGASRGSSTL